TVSPTTVALSGQPIDSAHLGSVDTIVHRDSDVVLAAVGSVGSSNLEIKALRLVGSVSVNGTTYDLKVCLSSFAGTAGSGTTTLTRSASDGGTFDSSFPVLPKLIFTPHAGGAAKTVDCGATGSGCPAAPVLGANGVCWLVSDGPSHHYPSGATVIAANIA